MSNINILSKRILSVVFSVVLIFASLPNVASAAQMTDRRVVIGSSAADIDTSYIFTFTVPQATILQSASFTACTTASGVCTPVPGFSTSTSTLSSQPVNLGDASGWVVDTSTVNSLRLSKTGNISAPTGSQTVSFSSVHNPSATNATFYMRLATFSDDSWTASVDSGVVASSTAGQVTVSVLIDEKLTFTLASTDVVLTEPSTSSTGTGTSSMTVSTNATSGYSLSYSGTTLISGSDTIPAMAVATTSIVNTEQFGLNLMANTTPAIGSDTAGIGSALPSVGYDTADQFKFNPAGDVIASTLVPTNDNTFTASYIVNMSGATPAGSYSTILTYVATANF